VLRIIQKEDLTTEEFKKELGLAVNHLEQMPLEKLSDWQKLMYFLFMFIYNRRDPSERSELISVVETNVKERILDILPMPKGRGFFLSECLSYIGYEAYT
jgi:hypothetical protein